MAGCSASASRRGSWWHEGEGKVVVVVGEWWWGGGQAAGAQDEASHRQPHFHLLQSKHRHMPLHVACADHLALHVFKQRDKKRFCLAQFKQQSIVFRHDEYVFLFVSASCPTCEYLQTYMLIGENKLHGQPKRETFI